MTPDELYTARIELAQDASVARAQLFHSFLWSLIAAIDGGDAERAALERENLFELFDAVNDRLVESEKRAALP